MYKGTKVQLWCIFKLQFFYQNGGKNMNWLHWSNLFKNNHISNSDKRDVQIINSLCLASQDVLSLVLPSIILTTVSTALSIPSSSSRTVDGQESWPPPRINNYTMFHFSNVWLRVYCNAHFSPFPFPGLPCIDWVHMRKVLDQWLGVRLENG